MPPIPHDTRLDSTVALLRDPYRFISRTCRRYRSDLFETRLLLQKTICITGRDATELFYDGQRFMRRGAPPGRIQKTLFGQGGVQGLDAEAHRHRKQLFMSVMTPEEIGRLVELSVAQWQSYSRTWSTLQQIVLYDEAREILTRAVCAWSGVPLPESEVGRRTHELTAMFEYAGAIGPKHWWSRLARRRAERWIEEVIERVRAGSLEPPDESPLRVIAMHRDLHGELLSPRVAAVEMLNVLRPTVAVAVFITFAALALHQHPSWRQKLAANERDAVELFVQEVRRFYPFFPSVIARVRHDFEWHGYRFSRDRRVVLDVYGTNHDARLWDAPEEFRPERFLRWGGDPFNFIPQGGRGCQRPSPLSGRRYHDRAHEGGSEPPGRAGQLRRTSAGPADRLVEAAGLAAKPVHHHQSSELSLEHGQ